MGEHVLPAPSKFLIDEKKISFATFFDGVPPP